jgi:hypothetical protein
MYRKVVINEFPEYETMMCRGHRSTPPDDDVDPVVLTMLTFGEAFRIAHTTRQGKTYVRGDQYRDVRSWMGDDNDNIVSWSGVWKRDPSRRMVGTFTVVDGGNGYRYTEKIYNGGRLETTIVSTCASAGGDSR